MEKSIKAKMDEWQQSLDKMYSVGYEAGKQSAIDSVIQALKKQEPMKPEIDIRPDGHVQRSCPNCHHEAIRCDNNCWNCGQKLDWED